MFGIGAVLVVKQKQLTEINDLNKPYIKVRVLKPYSFLLF